METAQTHRLSLVERLEIDAAQTCAEIVTFLRREVHRLARRGLVIGLSGGLDSTVCAYLCARAVGPERIWAQLMPERDSAPGNLADAQVVARVLGLDVTQLDQQMGAHRWEYLPTACQTARLPEDYELVPILPDQDVIANAIRTTPPGLICLRERILPKYGKDWATHFGEHNLCSLSVIECHSHRGDVGYGLPQGFNLSSGAVASSMGDDAHNTVVAGTNEADMRLAVETVGQDSGELVIVEDGEAFSVVALPLVGLLSDKGLVSV